MFPQSCKEFRKFEQNIEFQVDDSAGQLVLRPGQFTEANIALIPAPPGGAPYDRVHADHKHNKSLSTPAVAAVVNLFASDVPMVYAYVGPLATDN